MKLNDKAEDIKREAEINSANKKKGLTFAKPFYINCNLLITTTRLNYLRRFV
jgi:hypothetical protein